jgi:hypothetical protein
MVPVVAGWNLIWLMFTTCQGVSSKIPYPCSLTRLLPLDHNVKMFFSVTVVEYLVFPWGRLPCQAGVDQEMVCGFKHMIFDFKHFLSVQQFMCNSLLTDLKHDKYSTPACLVPLPNSPSFLWTILFFNMIVSLLENLRSYKISSSPLGMDRARNFAANTDNQAAMAVISGSLSAMIGFGWPGSCYPRVGLVGDDWFRLVSVSDCIATVFLKQGLSKTYLHGAVRLPWFQRQIRRYVSYTRTAAFLSFHHLAYQLRSEFLC